MNPTPIRPALQVAIISVLWGAPCLLPGQVLIPPGDYVETGSWRTQDISFRFDQDANGSFETSAVSAGIERADVTYGSTVTSIWDLCAEFYIPGAPTPPSYGLSLGFGPGVDATEETGIRLLISNTLPFFEAERIAGNTDAAEVYASAIQIAYWEIIEDTNDSLITDSTNPLAGTFQVDFNYVSSDPDTSPARLQAEAFLASISSGSWTDQGGYIYHYADTDGSQDRLWIATSVVPEPSMAVLLGLAGGTCLLCRRRG